MAGESWKSRTLDDCATFGSGGTPFKGRADFWIGTIPWVSAKDLKVFRLHDSEDHVTAEAVDAGSRLAPAGSIFLLVRGMTLHNDVPICVAMRDMAFNQDIKALMPKAGVDGAFLTYWLLAQKPALLSSVDSAGHGTGRLNTDTLKAMAVSLPPLAEQKAIAAVLGALDDKIELNRRMNATLEAMARALFQSWFVDFDPVRAKLDGRPPAALDPATAALFPASFDETELGHIPHGWEVKTLGEVIELAYGKPLKAEDRKNGPVCVYGANGPVGWHDEKLVSGPGIVVGRKGNPGVVTWAHGDFYPIDTTFYVEPIGSCRSLYFFYYALSLHNLANLSADSAVPGLNRNHAYMSKQVIPSQPVLTAFDSQIAPIFASIHANEEQSRSLGTVRDTLLPKLLSGELTVPLIPSAE